MMHTAKNIKGYRLLDSGNAQRLEDWDGTRIIRSDINATWQPSLDISEWEKATAIFNGDRNNSGKWSGNTSFTAEVSVGAIKMLARPTPAGHMGIFPENAVHWQFMADKIGSALKGKKVLNLFGYTGGASLMAAALGAEVTHVDTSKPALTWGRENQSLSNLETAKIRWIPEDASVFAAREVRRGNTYDGILLDPPYFGHGTKKSSSWNLLNDLPLLLDDLVRVLSDTPLFLILTCYTSDVDLKELRDLIKNRFPKGQIDIGQMALEESSSQRLLPCAQFVRWWLD